MFKLAAKIAYIVFCVYFFSWFFTIISVVFASFVFASYFQDILKDPDVLKDLQKLQRSYPNSGYSNSYNYR